MTGIIAVHCGAGHHNRKLHKEYRKLCSRACLKGIKVLNEGGSAMEAVKAAIIVLENDPLTNAGFGSNLTTDGFVEGDASIMDGKSLIFGGCGAIRKVKNPITLAYDICVKQSEPLPLGLVPPSLLVGLGGLQYARHVGLKIVNNKSLISEKAMKQFQKYKRVLDLYENKQKLLDTVGAICVDNAGHVASGCSSGGLLLKKPGRVGQAALYGSGSWADSCDKDSEPSVAVSTTGCGEHLVQTQLAKQIAIDLKNTVCPARDLFNTMTENFLKSRYLRNVELKMGGALVLHINNENGEASLLWGHSTETMGVGYMTSTDQKPKSMISVLPNGFQDGQTINVSGAFFCVKDCPIPKNIDDQTTQEV